jgi:hypothetical protein
MEATTAFFVLLLVKCAHGILVTNSPLFLSRISPILYHEACFSDRGCLERSTDGVLYVSCHDCKDGTGQELLLGNCHVRANEIVGISSDCTILGGFCASVTTDEYRCVPAVPVNGSWWPEAVPSPSQKCREKCGIDRAYFKRWNKTGGFERNCLCTIQDEPAEHDPAEHPPQQRRTIYENREIHWFLYRDPFPFCYFEQCNFVVDYGSRNLLGVNFTTVNIEKRSNVLAVSFQRESDASGTDCSTVNLPIIVTDEHVTSACVKQKSYLFLHPQHLPDFYILRT